MKIRNGFVSNSSSSSFIVKGYNLSKEEFTDLFKDNKEIQEYLESQYYPEVEETLRAVGLDGVVDYNDWEDPTFYIGDVIGFESYGMEEIDLSEIINGTTYKEFDKMFPGHRFKLGEFAGSIGDG
jgi:hypothetical protein